jgi:hypothetical protein
MTAPVWTTGTDSAGSLAANLTLTAPGTAAGELAIVTAAGVTSSSGVAPASVTLTRSGTGTITQIIAPTAAVNVWWCAWAVAGVAASETLAVTGDVSYYMTTAAAGYDGGFSVGNVSTVGTRPSSAATIDAPAFTAQAATSTIVDLWAARDSGSTGLTSVTTGTIRISQRSGSGNLIPVAAISDYAASSTTVTSVTGTFGTASGNGSAAQIELLGSHTVFNNAEGGSDGTAVTAANSGGGSGTAFSQVSTGITFSKAQKAHGLLSYALSAASGTQNYIHFSSPATTGGFSIRTSLRLTGYPSAVSSFVLITDSTDTTITGFNLESTGKITPVQSGGTAITGGKFTNAIPLNTWVRITITGTIGTSATVTMTMYTGDSTTPIETHTFTGVNTGTVAPAYVSYGKLTKSPSIGTYYLDDLAQNLTSTTEIGPLAGNSAPTADAGDDQDGIQPFATVYLDGSGSNSASGSLTYAWTQTAGATVTLSSSTAQKPTFTAPALPAGDTLTFSLTVTDSNGTASTANTVDITVLPHTVFLIGDGGTPVPIKAVQL